LVTENIIDSINKELERSLTVKDNEILKKWEIHHRLLQGVASLEQLIESGTVGKDKQALLDEVKKIAQTIKPTNSIAYG